MRFRSRGPHGETIADNSFLLCFNAHFEPVAFTMPQEAFGTRWHRVIDTADPDLARRVTALGPGRKLTVPDRSLVVLQRDELARAVSRRRARKASRPDGIALAPAAGDRFADAIAMTNNPSAFGLYPSCRTLHLAADALRSARFRQTDISILYSDGLQAYRLRESAGDREWPTTTRHRWEGC